jgi:hypothetical protein
MKELLKKWHEVLKKEDASLLNELLAENCTFHSPILHKPQEGSQLTQMYLLAAASVFNNGTFRYEKEIVSDNHAALEFVVEIEGITMNGVDIITKNDEGKIEEFKVMMRPYKAVEFMLKKMSEALA